MVTIDTTDAERLAGWWADQLGAKVTETNGGWYVVLAGGGLPALLSFQKVDDPTPGKNKLHLDLVTDDLASAVDELVAAGAAVVGRRGEGLPVGHPHRPRRQRVLRLRPRALRGAAGVLRACIPRPRSDTP